MKIIPFIHPSSPESPVVYHREDPPSLQRSYGRTRWRFWLRRVPQSLPGLGQGLNPPVVNCPAASFVAKVTQNKYHGVLHRVFDRVTLQAAPALTQVNTARLSCFLLITALLVPPLLLSGCRTIKSHAGGTISPSEAEAEVSLAESQKEEIIQDNITATASKKVFEIGDKIAVQIWLRDKVSQLSGYPLELLVGESGRLFMPHVGLLKVTEKTVNEVQAELQTILSKTLNDITVIVARKGQMTMTGLDGKSSVELGRHFIVMGRIMRPGLYPLEHGLRVRDAIAIAGGLEHYAHPNIFLVRGDRVQPEVMRINMKDIFFGRNMKKNVLLTSNDAIYVTPKLLWNFADFVQLLFSPVTSVRDTLWVYDRTMFNKE